MTPRDIIGRDKELKYIQKILDSASSGTGCTVFVSGETGIGKTYLIDAIKDIAISSDILVLSGTAESDRTCPFQVLSEAFGSLTDKPLFQEQELKRFVKIFAVNMDGLLVAEASLEEDDLDSDIFAGMLSAVQNFVKDSFDPSGNSQSGLGRLEYGDLKILIEHGKHIFLVGVIDGDEHPEMKEVIKRTLHTIEEDHGVVLESWFGDMKAIAPVHEKIRSLADRGFLVRKQLEGITLENERFRISHEVLESLKHSSREKPILVSLENLQWSDESSLFVINYLARNIKNQPIMLLCSLRPYEYKALDDTVEIMKKEGILEEVILEKLNHDDTELLIDSILGPNDLPDQYINRLYDQSKGNPFFIVEILGAMIDDGSIVRGDDKCKFVSDSMGIPSTIEEIVNRKLENLDLDSMAMAEYLSCIGHRFDISAAASNPISMHPNSALDKLLQSGVIVKKNGDMEFSHAVFQDVIYKGIGNRWKLVNHKTIGEHLELSYSDRLDEVIFDMAKHFSRTKEYDKTSRYCITAGEKAESSFALEQSLKFYDDALLALSNINDVQENRSQILERTGDILNVLGHPHEAKERFQRSKELSDDLGLQARMLRKIGNTHETMGKYHEALEIYFEAKALLGTDTEEYGRVILSEGIIYLNKGDLDGAMETLLESVLVFERTGGNKKDMGDAFRVIGNIHWKRGDYSQASDNYDKSYAAMEEAGYTDGMAKAIHNIGVYHDIIGDSDKALEYHKRCLEIQEKLKYKRGIAQTLDSIGNVHIEKGEFDVALKLQERSLEIRKEMGDLSGISNSLFIMGNIYGYKGDLPRSLEYHKRSLDIREGIGDMYYVASSLNSMGELNVLMGELDRALEYSRKSLDIRQSIGDHSGTVSSLGNIAEIYFYKGDLSRASKYFYKCLELNKEIGSLRLSSIIYSCLAEVTLKDGDFDSASDLALKSLELSDEISNRVQQGVGHRILGMINRETGELEKAMEEFNKAQDILNEVGEKNELTRLYFELSLLYKAMEDVCQAQEYLSRARLGYEETGNLLWINRCLELTDELDL